MRQQLLRSSTRSIDPMSWYSTSNYQLVLGVVTLIVALALIAVTANTGVLVGQICALALVLPAFPLLRTGGNVAYIRVRSLTIVVPTLLSTAAIIVSALSVDPLRTPLLAWWPQYAAVAVLASTVSFCTPIALLLVTALPATALGVSVGVLWAPQGGLAAYEAVAAATVVLISVGVTGAMFTLQLDAAVRAWNRDHGGSADAAPAAGAATSGSARVDAELREIVGEAASFVAATAAGERVDSHQRERARELAHRLRDRLVARMNRSWLHDIDPTITVVDPSQRGAQLSVGQRVALRGLIERAMSAPEYRDGSMRVDIAVDGHGMTVVAIGLDLDLPEGRRLALLAPQLLTLRRSVAEFEWLRGRAVRLRFRLPPAN